MTPEAAAVEAQAELARLAEEAQRWEAQRKRAVLELRAAGWTHAQVAKLLGVSRARAAQLAK